MILMTLKDIYLSIFRGNMKTEILNFEDEKCINILQEGELLCFPTDTIYGVGCIYDNYDAFLKMIKIKNRPIEKPFTLMLADKTQIKDYAYIDQKIQKIIDVFLPGELTLILKAKPNYPWVVFKESTIGIRVSGLKKVRDLISKIGKPLLVTSINKSGKPPLNDVKNIYQEFSSLVKGIVEYKGYNNSEVASTIIQIKNHQINLIREGKIKFEEILNIAEKNNMKIAIGSDHGGFNLKAQVITYLKEKGYKVNDVGTYSNESCAYSEFALKCALEVTTSKADRGIVICTTGEGVCIAANKVKGIRCGLIYNDEVAKLTREHNDCNMIAIGAKFTSIEQAKEYIDIFLNTPFAGERHIARVNIIKDFEKNN